MKSKTESDKTGMNVTACPVCNSEMGTHIEGLFDDRYGYPGSYDLLKCKKCDHLSLNKKFSVNELRELYTEYYPRKELTIEDYAPSKPSKSFLRWLKGEKSSAYQWVPENVRVLDIGCGFGQTLGYHESRGCEVYGVEADENIKRVVDKFGFKVHVGLFHPDIYDADYFDDVTMDQVIEHDQDVIRDLNGIHRILKKDGRLILSTPNAFGWGAKLFGKRWINWHTPYHNNLVSRRSVEVLAEKTGFQVEMIKTITHSSWLYYQLCHLVTYPALGEKSRFWSGKKTIIDLMIRAPIILANKVFVFAILTRIFDRLNLGDSLVIVLKKNSRNDS
jgi:SAM-dependent methyltransferase